MFGIERKLLAGSLALGLSLAGAYAAQAVTTTATCTGDLSRAIGSDVNNFTTTLDYTPSSPTSAELVVALDNISPSSSRGFLTAFLLNNPHDQLTSVTLTSSTLASFDTQLGLSNNGEIGAPFGRYDFGATTSGSYEGGGAPSAGIPAGDSVSFTFDLTGTSLDTLTASDFLSEQSVGPGIGHGSASFLVRFRGAHASKVPCEGEFTPPIPEPLTSTLGALSLGGLLLATRRRRSA